MYAVDAHIQRYVVMDAMIKSLDWEAPNVSQRDIILRFAPESIII